MATGQNENCDDDKKQDHCASQALDPRQEHELCRTLGLAQRWRTFAEFAS